MSHHNKHEHDHRECQPGCQEPLEALAYRLWERAGRPEGQAERFWSEAQEQMRQAHHPATASH